jgi:APA family basic amino acid/polyamine antiporter
MIGSGIFIVSSDMVRQLDLQVSNCYVVLTGFLTVVAAVSYGELSAMFPKAGGNMCILRKLMSGLLGFYMAGAFLR